MKKIVFISLISLILLNSCNTENDTFGVYNKNNERSQIIPVMLADIGIIKNDLLIIYKFDNKTNSWSSYSATSDFEIPSETEKLLSLSFATNLYAYGNNTIKLFNYENEIWNKKTSDKLEIAEKDVVRIGISTMGIINKNDEIEVYDFNTGNEGNYLKYDDKANFKIPEKTTGFINFGFNGIGFIRQNQINFYNYINSDTLKWKKSEMKPFSFPKDCNGLISIALNFGTNIGVIYNDKIDFFTYKDEKWSIDDKLTFTFNKVYKEALFSNRCKLRCL